MKVSSFKISVPNNKGVEYIDINHIIRIEADRSYSTIYLINRRKTIVSKTLNSFDKILTNSQFCRVHNSHLINVQHVKLYIRGDGGMVEMNDSSVVPVSRNQKINFLKKMEEICLM